MTLRLDPAANAETHEAAVWYEEQQHGLGVEFLAAVDSAMHQIEQSPQRYARLETIPEEADVRRLVLDRFPYAIIFEAVEDEVRILAVAHTHRRPNYWKGRQ